ncbi:YDG domain-containing protein [Sphingomonas sp. LR60]|uniref:YDG domain-containing protein n=1 Tax=Sphingomonas sp. LR60 TaxID=3050233 RepID=UPI002FE0495E
MSAAPRAWPRTETTNSLVGATAYETSPLGGDNVGSSVIALANGAYVILSPNWNKTRGAATYVAAGGAITGTINSSNSLVGTTGAENDRIYCASCESGRPAMFGGDYVGSGGVTVLGNSNFLIASPNWSQQRGAVTFVNGTTGALVDGTGSLTGSISAANSLVGAQAATRYISSYNYTYGNTVGLRYWVGGDRVGSNPEGASAPIDTIGNDRFLLINTNWRNRTGAVTLGKSDGTFAGGGIFAGQVSAANSLVGSTAGTLFVPSNVTREYYSILDDGDRLGSDRFKVLADGRIAIFSSYWSGMRGATTLMDGTTGLHGTVSVANSAIGTTTGDQVGFAGPSFTYDLANGKTLFVNPYTAGNAGAVTEVAVGGSFTGTLDATNSLVGAASGDSLGNYGVIRLPGGSYIINSIYAGNGRSAITYHDGATPLTGTMSLRNSFYGDAMAPTFFGLGYKLSATGSLLLNFSQEGTGRITLGFADPTGWTYARAAQSTMTIAPSLIEKSLNNGTSLVLQASSNIFINDAIATAGNATGNLTLEAGHSIAGGADISLGAGNLTLLANSSVANGVVDAQRDAGNAEIALASSTITTTGAVSIKLALSTDKTYNDASNIALGTIHAGTVDVRNLGSASGSLTLNGAITATGSGTSILLATGGAFVNNAGAAALSAGAGRFLVYSADPRNNTLGGLTADGKFYGRTLSANPPSSLSATDDLFVYSVVPVLTVTGNTTVGYGDSAGSVTPSVTGFIDGDTQATALSGAVTTSTSYQAGNAVGGSYALTIGQGTLASPLGYAITFANGTVTVTPKVLTLALTGSVGKQYDRTTAATLSQGNFQLTGLYGSDSIAIGTTSGSYATANVGTHLNVTASLSAGDFTAGSGTLLSNYVLPTGSTSATIGTITARALTLAGLSAVDRTYNGTTTVALSGGSLSGVLSGDTVGFNAGSGALADRNVGIGKAVSLSSFTLTGAAAGNYVLSQPSGLTATITAKQLTLGGVAAQGRAYDGTTAIALTGGSLSGVVGSDIVGVAGGTGVSASRNAGTHAVSASGFALNGADAGNYLLAGQPTGLSATITPLAVTLSGVSAVNRSYDGTTTVALTSGTVAGLLGGDAVSLVQGSGSLANRNVGIGKSVSVTGFALSGADAANYSLGGVPSALSVDIAARALSVSGLAAQDRVYDGTTTVALTGGTLADRNVGVGKAVSLSGFGLTGADAGNYVIGQPSGLTATITAKQLALGGVTTQARAYDGTTAVALSGGSLSGVIGGDAVGFATGTGTAASKNAGTQAVTASGFALTGADAGNYALAGQPIGLSIAIAQRSVMLSGVGAIDRTYDGTTTVALTGGTVAGLLGGDTVSLVQGTGNLADRNVGIGKTVTVAGFQLSGADAANYALGGVPNTLSVDIAAKAISLSGVTALDRSYDGTTNVALSGGTLSGLVGADAVGLVTGTGSLADRNVGTGKTVTVSGFALNGSDAGNYVLSGQPSSLTATITAKQLALGGVTTQARAYDGTTAVALSGGTLSGVVGGDAVGFATGTGTAASKNAGTQAVTAGGFALTGADAGNYALAGQPTGLSVAIAQRAVTLSGVGAIDRTYDGTTTVALTGGTVAGLLGGDTVSLVQGTGSLADRNVGTGKTVTVAGFQLSGADAANYALGGVPNTLSVDIAAKAISLSGVTALDRSYDGTTNVALSGGTLSGLVGADAVGLVTGTGSLADRNVGTGKTVTVSGFVLNGSDAGNYVLSGQPSSLTATITAKQLALGGVTTQARAYDGTTAVALSGGTLSGVVGGDAVDLTHGTGTAASKNAGTQAVTASGFALTGADAGNYALAGQPTGLSVAIDPARLSVELIAGSVSKTYDGTSTAALTPSSYRIRGVVAGESIGIARTAGAFASANAGQALPVSVLLSASDYLAGAGTSLANYALPTGSVVGAAGTILPAALLVRADDQVRMSGDPMPVLTASYSGFVGSDTAASTGIAPILSTDATVQSPAGSYVIYASGGQLANYVVTYRNGTMTVTPAPVPVPLQALVATQPLQSLLATPVAAPSTAGEVAVSTGLATSFVPTPPAVPLNVGNANATLTIQDRSVQGANEYANSFISSLKLESRK